MACPGRVMQTLGLSWNCIEQSKPCVGTPLARKLLLNARQNADFALEFELGHNTAWTGHLQAVFSCRHNISYGQVGSGWVNWLVPNTSHYKVLQSHHDRHGLAEETSLATSFLRLVWNALGLQFSTAELHVQSSPALQSCTPRAAQD